QAKPAQTLKSIAPRVGPPAKAGQSAPVCGRGDLAAIGGKACPGAQKHRPGSRASYKTRPVRPGLWEGRPSCDWRQSLPRRSKASPLGTGLLQKQASAPRSVRGATLLRSAAKPAQALKSIAPGAGPPTKAGQSAPVCGRGDLAAIGGKACPDVQKP